MSSTQNILPINISCHFAEFRDGEQFVQMHSLGMVVAGSMELNDGTQNIIIKEGEMFSARKKHLLKFVKHLPEQGEFKSLSISFDENMLRNFSKNIQHISPKLATETAFTRSTLFNHRKRKSCFRCVSRSGFRKFIAFFVCV